MAEREGFEPPERANAQRFSRPPLSTTQPPLQRYLNNATARSGQVIFGINLLNESS